MESANTYRLVPLECPTCGAAVAARGQDVVYYCTACRNGYRFDSKLEELAPVEVGFVSTPNVVAEAYRPFWLLPSTIEIRHRDAQGGGLSGLGGLTGLLGYFLSGPESSGTPAGEGRFAVPAFHTPIASLVELTKRYTRELPGLDERMGERLLGGRYGAADARKLAHFSLIESEVDKPDTLKNLDYKIRFGEPVLLGVPFTRRGDRLVDALFGIEA